jgi:hypothetical protein
MENKELYQTLEELRAGQITTNIAMEQILLLFDVVGRSELLVCDCKEKTESACKALFFYL